MKINFSLVLDEEQLRCVRAAAGRGGKATRNEVRVWLQRLADTALREGPNPKRRRVAVVPVAVEDSPRRPALPEVEVTEETRCRHCQRRYASHGKMSGTCPPGFGARIGSRFQAVTS